MLKFLPNNTLALGGGEELTVSKLDSGSKKVKIF